MFSEDSMMDESENEVDKSFFWDSDDDDYNNAMMLHLEILAKEVQDIM